MQSINNNAISNARRLADITTLLAAAESADEAREVFRARYPDARDQDLTPPEGAPGEPEFWLRFAETARKLERNCLHFDFDAEYILATAPTAEGREILYEGALRDGSDGVIYVCHVLDVIDDPELSDLIENDGVTCAVGHDLDEGFVDAQRAGHDPDEWRVEWRERYDAEGDPIGWRLESRDGLGLDDERESAVAAIMARIDSEIFAGRASPIRSDLLLSSIQNRSLFAGRSAITLIDEAVEKLKTGDVEDWFALAAPIDDEKVLVMSDPYFQAWLWENLKICA